MTDNQKPIEKWSKKEFEDLPDRKWNEDIGDFDSLVILPTRRIHDSGYTCMDFVVVIDRQPICRLSGCSDVIHIGGIGGFGKDFKECRDLVPPTAWTIDCLPKSKLLRLFSNHKLTAGEAISSFQIYSK